MIDRHPKRIYESATASGNAQSLVVDNINPYLVNAPNVVLPGRSVPICAAPGIGVGNKPIDDGNFLFTPDERIEFLKREPAARQYFRRWLGASEFINGIERYCLWLINCSPTDLRALPEVRKRVEAVRKFRLASKSPPTRRLADTPTRFHVENAPKRPYLVFPRHSSETRVFVPLGFVGPENLAGDANLISSEATIFHFGVLSSTMHNAWIRYTCGRLKSDFRYSKDIVYNNFPWPENPSDAQKQKIEAAAQGVLDARTAHPNASLADLYDPLTMPPNLVKAHQVLDAAVDAAYGRKNFKNDAERVAFLFELYQRYTSLLPASKVTSKRQRAVRN